MIVPLDAQDRSLWRWEAIRGGLGILSRALEMRRSDLYRLQASISALHARSRRADDVRWSEIAALNARLAELLPTPVVALNRAVAVGRSEGPKEGLAILEEIRPAKALLESYAPWDAAGADLLERAGRLEEATAALRALELTRAPPERRHLVRRLELLMAWADPFRWIHGRLHTLLSSSGPGRSPVIYTEPDLRQIAELS